MLGFGFSNQPEDLGYQVSDHALQISRFVKDRGFERIDIYGHSMGGSIAIEAANLLGDKISHLVLSEANLDSGGGEFSRPIANLSESAYIAHGHRRSINDAVTVGYEGWASTKQTASAHAVYHGAKVIG